jgi:hypothetical protein
MATTTWRLPPNAGRNKATDVLSKPHTWVPTQIAALAFGVWWIGNGIAVFLADGPSVSPLDSGGDVEALGVAISVNGWHGLLHLTTGVTGVAACVSPVASRAYALIIGTLYLAAAASSVVTGSTVFGLIQVDALGSAEHAIEGVVLLLTVALTPMARHQTQTLD